MVIAKTEFRRLFWESRQYVGLTLNGVPIMRAAPKASQNHPQKKQRLQRLKFSGDRVYQPF